MPCKNCSNKCKVEVQTNPKWTANIEDDCDECSRKSVHNHIMKGTYHIDEEGINQDDCDCGCRKPEYVKIKIPNQLCKNCDCELRPNGRHRQEVKEKGKTYCDMFKWDEKSNSHKQCCCTKPEPRVALASLLNGEPDKKDD